MADAESDAQQRATQLHAEEDARIAAAGKLPEGPKKDELRMTAERLSDEAWEIEEANDIEVKPSGLWPA